MQRSIHTIFILWMKIRLFAFISSKLSYIMLKLNKIKTIYMEFFIICPMSPKLQLEQLTLTWNKGYVVGHNGQKSSNYRKIHQKWVSLCSVRVSHHLMIKWSVRESLFWIRLATITSYLKILQINNLVSWRSLSKGPTDCSLCYSYR